MNNEPRHEGVVENPFEYISEASNRIKKAVSKMREQGKQPAKIGSYIARETKYLVTVSPHIGKTIHIDTLTLLAGQPDGSIWAGAGNIDGILRGFTVLDNVLVGGRAIDGLCMVMEVRELNGSTDKIPNDPVLPPGVADQLKGIPVLVAVDDSPILEEIPE